MKKILFESILLNLTLSYNFYSYISILFRYMLSNIRKSAKKNSSNLLFHNYHIYFVIIRKLLERCNKIKKNGEYFKK